MFFSHTTSVVLLDGIVNLGLMKFQNRLLSLNYLLTLQDLENCLKLRKAQVDKIEATYAYLQEQPSGNNTKLLSEIAPDSNCLNQDLIKVTEKIKLRKEEKVDYEMVLNIFLTLFSFLYACSM